MPRRCRRRVNKTKNTKQLSRILVDDSLAKDAEIVFDGNTHDEAIRMKFEDSRLIEEPLIFDFARPSDEQFHQHEHRENELLQRAVNETLLPSINRLEGCFWRGYLLSD